MLLALAIKTVSTILLVNIRDCEEKTTVWQTVQHKK